MCICRFSCQSPVFVIHGDFRRLSDLRILRISVFLDKCAESIIFFTVYDLSVFIVSIFAVSGHKSFLPAVKDVIYPLDNTFFFVKDILCWKILRKALAVNGRIIFSAYRNGRIKHFFRGGVRCIGNCGREMNTGAKQKQRDNTKH